MNGVTTRPKNPVVFIDHVEKRIERASSRALVFSPFIDVWLKIFEDRSS